jgi:Protein of unknown function, DUF547
MNMLWQGLSLAFLLFLPACALTPAAFNANPPDHVLWDGFLQKHIKNDQIDADSILKDSMQLRFYLAYLSRRHPHDHWDQSTQLVYWINLHNALLLAQKYAPSALNPLQNKNGKIRIERKVYVLRQVKNKVLHVANKDGRSLFALYQSQENAIPMLNRALTPASLPRQLDQLSKSYLNNPEFNQINAEQVYLSPFFRKNRRFFRPFRAFVTDNCSAELPPHFKIKFRK